MATAILDHAVCNTELCISLVSNRPFATELCLELLPQASGMLSMVSNLEFYTLSTITVITGQAFSMADTVQ